MADPMEFKDMHDYFLVRLSNKFNVLTVPEVRKAVECAVNMGRKNLLFDMSKTIMMDSAAIGLLIMFYKQIISEGGNLYLAAVPSNLLKMLETVKLLKVFQVFKTVGEADLILRTGIEKEECGFYILFKLPKDFDLTIIKSLREALNEALSKNYIHFVFDFEKTRRINSVGIGILTNLHKQLHEKKGSVHLVNLSPDVKAVLEAAQVLHVLPVYKNIDEIQEMLMKAN
jgi:anti-anti-sigma factor